MRSIGSSLAFAGGVLVLDAVASPYFAGYSGEVKNAALSCRNYAWFGSMFRQIKVFLLAIEEQPVGPDDELQRQSLRIAPSGDVTVRTIVGRQVHAVIDHG